MSPNENEALQSSDDQLPVLSDGDLEQIEKLGEYAVKIENHYGEPQDIEWVIDRDGQIYLMQSRPLRVYRKTAHAGDLDLTGHRVLVETGVTAASGAGGGRPTTCEEKTTCPAVPTAR